MRTRTGLCAREAVVLPCMLAVLTPVGAAQTLHWERPGESALDEYGTAVAPAGDVDGDGADDVIVGAYRADVGSITPGRASVHSGRDGSVILALAGRTNDE